MDEIKTELSAESTIRFNVIDVDADRMAASQYNVRSVPTVVVENNGVVVQQLIGVKSKSEYLSAIQQAKFNK
jgi:thioredoxin 1